MESSGLFFLSCTLKFSQLYFLCHVEKVKDKVRRKGRKVVSQRLVPSDFLLPACSSILQME